MIKRKNLKFEKKEKMIMENFQLPEDQKKKVEAFCKKNKIKKCDFYRTILKEVLGD